MVWHTQGSGKSITMTCFAARVMQETAMENPTIVVITDRNDLDGQLFGVFSLAQDLLREQPVQAETRQDLRTKLANRPSGGIIFATIQKFMPDADEDFFPRLSDRHNIVVIADEAHRTQYGFEAKLRTFTPKTPTTSANDPLALLAAEPTASYQVAYQVGYAQHLRDALPNATFVAFTGTPVSSEDRDTRAVFGDYIHIYDMQQAKEDGATVAIYFESRLAKLALKEDELPHLDEEVEELAEDEEESQQARLKSRWAALEKVVGAEPRIAQVAADIVAHFEERNKAQDGKAMVVAMSREICVHLYNEIVKLRPDWHDADPENRGDELGLSEDEVRFYDALANNESAVRELTDETLKKIAHELTDNLRKNLTVDWSKRENVRATLRLMVKRILRKYKYPPDQQEEAIELVLRQAEALGEAWA